MMRYKHMLWILIALAQLGLVQIAGAEDQDTNAWQLLPQAQVDSSGIFLNQLIVPPSTAAALPQIRLAPAPNLGQTASLSRDQIAELARKVAPEVVISNWSGATQVRVSRVTRQFVEYDLLDLLTGALQRDYVKDRGELELHLTHDWTPVAVPDEPLTLKAFDLPSSGINSDFVVRCELWNGKERVGEWRVALKASIWRDVPVAQSVLNRGELLRDADVALERRDVLVLRDAFVNYSHADENLQLVGNIPAGQPVLNRSVRPRPIIQRGQLVEGIYEDGALSISLKVELLEDGLLGQTVRIRNPKTKRELHGKVQNDQTVVIAL
jgi:flagellar basal body P-ring formation protein FlgA